jgi:hypothetical protein
MNTLTLTQQERKTCRSVAGESWTARSVVVVKGNAEPTILGKSYYWTTPSGKTIVHHPNAYGWPTWYHGSTLRVEVGEEWLEYRRKYDSEWPRAVSPTLSEFRETLVKMWDSRRVVDILADQLCGYRYGTWRRDEKKRATVLAAILQYRSGSKQAA